MTHLVHSLEQLKIKTMKKIMILLLAIAATINVMATVTAKVTIKVTAVEGGEYFVMKLIQNDALADGEKGTGSAIVNWDGRTMGFFVDYDNAQYQNLALNSFEGLEFGLKTNASASYTLEVTSATYTGIDPLIIKDGNTGNEFTLTTGAKTTISIDDADKNGLVAGRLAFHTPAPVPGEPSICFKNKHLLVENATEEVKVLNEDKTEYLVSTDADIDLSGAPVAASPYYWVVFEGDTMKINLNPVLE